MAEVDTASHGGGGGGEEQSKAWHWYIPEDLSQSFKNSTDTALVSARSFQLDAFSRFRSFQNLIPDFKLKLHSYEDAFFRNLKDGVTDGIQHPAVPVAVTLAATFLFLRGPRRFLLHNTVGRLQSEEARFVKAEKNLKMLDISVDLMKKESRKLLERTTFAHKEMTNGQAELINVGKQIQRLTKSVSHAESQAADLMDVLREMSGREALRLRAEVASVASLLKLQRTALVKKMNKISEARGPL